MAITKLFPELKDVVERVASVNSLVLVRDTLLPSRNAKLVVRSAEV